MLDASAFRFKRTRVSWSHVCEDELERLGYETVLGRAGYGVTAAHLELRVDDDEAAQVRDLEQRILHHHGRTLDREGDGRRGAWRTRLRGAIALGMLATLALAYACG